ncbi:hypothetical protein AAG570_009960, partial [Ranatra chinensis]
SQLDEYFNFEISIHEINLPSRRLIYSPTRPLNLDYDDVRSFSEAASEGIKRAMKAGIKSPLLLLQPNKRFEQCKLVTLLGVMEALYMNLQYREDCKNGPKIEKLGVWSDKPAELERLIEVATALECGRITARDIGGSDPERMAPPRVEEYVRKIFPEGCGVKIESVSDPAIFDKDYPLFSAVNRAASVIERHCGRIIYLTYEGSNPTKSLLLVGKGVTYDTGGADIKAGGVMAGMSRDKCGAAAVAGFLKVVSLLKPKHLKVVGAMSMVRNSVGENSYVADEMITARSGKRIRIGNTDAEGRMIMADVLCKMKELAVNNSNIVDPHLFTIATLTGHAVLTVGHGYSIAMDNGPARSANSAQQLQKSGDVVGDPVEISTIRREDFAFHNGQTEGEDIIQANNKPSSQTNRGHQGPAAFLILASGLNEHGLDSDRPLCYSHLDIAGSAGDVPEPATGAPILALTSRYIGLNL